MVDYHEYLQSPAWDAKRREVIARAKGRCEHCGDQAPLQVHHLHYDTLGHESLMDLEALCEVCHGFADDERKEESAAEKGETFFEARLDGWANKVFGSNWRTTQDEVDVRERFQNWLEENGFD